MVTGRRGCFLYGQSGKGRIFIGSNAQQFGGRCGRGSSGRTEQGIGRVGFMYGRAEQGLRGCHFADVGAEQGQTFRRRLLYPALIVIARAVIGDPFHNRNGLRIPDLLVCFQNCQRKIIIYAPQVRLKTGAEHDVQCVTVTRREQVRVGGFQPGSSAASAELPAYDISEKRSV